MSYVPDVPGRYTSTVKYGGDEIPASPFRVLAVPSGDASKCLVTGGAAPQCPYADLCHPFAGPWHPLTDPQHPLTAPQCPLAAPPQPSLPHSISPALWHPLLPHNIHVLTHNVPLLSHGTHPGHPCLTHNPPPPHGCPPAHPLPHCCPPAPLSPTPDLPHGSVGMSGCPQDRMCRPPRSPPAPSAPPVPQPAPQPLLTALPGLSCSIHWGPWTG